MNKELNDILRVMISSEELDKITSDIAKQIDEDYKDNSNRIVLLSILKGSVVFMGELMRKLETPVEIEFMKVSSYGSGTATTGNINIHLDLQRKDINLCDVIIVEDIIDSGRTLSYLVEYLKRKGVHSVKTCTLLDKPSRREVEFNADYIGVEVPDEFVVGYGLDYDEKYRTLPFIGILKPEAYEK